MKTGSGRHSPQWVTDRQVQRQARYMRPFTLRRLWVIRLVLLADLPAGLWIGLTYGWLRVLPQVFVTALTVYRLSRYQFKQITGTAPPVR